MSEKEHMKDEWEETQKERKFGEKSGQALKSEEEKITRKTKQVVTMSINQWLKQLCISRIEIWEEIK